MKRKRIIGYLRVSTQDQDVEKNKTDISALANSKSFGKVEFFEEKVSGTKDWRSRKIGEVVSALQKGDVIIVSELSRFARSTFQVFEVMNECTKKGIAVYAVKGDWELNGSMQSKILLNVFSMLAEIERDLISERTKEGLRAARAKGKLLGRPKGPGKSKLDSKETEILALLRNGSPQTFVAKRYGTSPENLNIWLKKRKFDYKPVVNPAPEMKEAHS